MTMRQFTREVILYDGSGNPLLTASNPGIVQLAAGSAAIGVVDTELPAAAALADAAASNPTTVTLAAILEAVQTGDSTKVDRLLQDLKRLAVSVYGKGAAAGDTALLLSDLNASAFSSGSSAPGPVVAHALLWGHDGSSAWGRLRQLAASSDTFSHPDNGVQVVQAYLRAVDGSNGVRVTGDVANGLDVDLTRYPAGSQQTLLAETTFNSNGTTNGTAVTGLDRYSLCTLQLTVAAKDLAGGGTVNIYVQRSVDGGTTWDDVASFKQITNAAVANGTYVLDLSAIATAGAADRATTDGTLTANSIRTVPWGDRLRVKVVAASFGAGDAVTLTLVGRFA